MGKYIKFVRGTYRDDKYRKGKFVILYDRRYPIAMPGKDGTSIFDISVKSIPSCLPEPTWYDLGYVEDEDIENIPKVPLYHIQDTGVYDDGLLHDLKWVPTDILDESKIYKIDEKYSKNAQVLPVPPSYFSFDDKDSSHPMFKGETIGQYLKRIYKEANLSITFDENLPTIFYQTDGQHPLSAFKIFSKVNDDLGSSLEDFTFPLDNFYFFHQTTFYLDTLQKKELCDRGRCDIENFDQHTGIYDIADRSNSRDGVIDHPGIYFTLGEGITIQSFDDVFEPIQRSAVYGPVSFIFPVKDIVERYRINLKFDHEEGTGREMSPKEFFFNENLAANEAIVRTSKIPLSLASHIAVNFSYWELRFIDEHLGLLGKHSISDVIDLYLKNRNSHWYIRKSPLLAVIDQCDRDFLIVPTFTSIDGTKRERKLYNSPYDVDSDHELLTRD